MMLSLSTKNRNTLSPICLEMEMCVCVHISDCWFWTVASIFRRATWCLTVTTVSPSCFDQHLFHSQNYDDVTMTMSSPDSSIHGHECIPPFLWACKYGYVPHHMPEQLQMIRSFVWWAQCMLLPSTLASCDGPYSEQISLPCHFASFPQRVKRPCNVVKAASHPTLAQQQKTQNCHF